MSRQLSLQRAFLLDSPIIIISPKPPLLGRTSMLSFLGTRVFDALHPVRFLPEVTYTPAMLWMFHAACTLRRAPAECGVVLQALAGHGCSDTVEPQWNSSVQLLSAATVQDSDFYTRAGLSEARVPQDSGKD